MPRSGSDAEQEPDDVLAPANVAWTRAAVAQGDRTR